MFSFSFFIVIVYLTKLLTVGHAVDSLRFLLIGDMGGVDYSPYYTDVEIGTAKEMAAIADLYNPQFILELGDNFYYNGVQNVDDKRFQETFEDVYSAPSLQIPWYLIAGNHDHIGNVSAQIAYTKKSSRWNFPDYFYSLNFNIPNSNAALQLVMIDTVLLVGNVMDDFHSDQPKGPKDHQQAETQWSWIEQKLNQSRATYLFSAGHYPVYSVAEHGPTDELVERLLPMLQKYRASGHLCGHDHNLQHLQTTNDGVTLDFILSGSANFIDNSTEHIHSVPKGVSQFHWADTNSLGGFVYVEATADNMTVVYLEANGSVLYRTNVFPRSDIRPVA